MGDITEELYRKFQRAASPPPRRHCCTCSCDDQENNSSRVTMSIPKLGALNEYDYPVIAHTRDYNRRRPYYCRMCESGCFGHTNTGPGISRYIDKMYYWDQKYSMLENWFKRFSYDDDGYLSLTELKCLLDRLGASVRRFNAKQIFDQADRDCDGRLSFPEFLLMWRIAAADDNSNTVGCNELQAIIRRHQLYPDVIEHSERKYHRSDLSASGGMRFRPVGRCTCCGYRRPIADEPELIRSPPRPNYTDAEDSLAEKKSPSSPKQPPDLSKTTIFSCNRYPVVD